jgi:hypothetical protein
MRFELIPLKPQFNMRTITPHLIKKFKISEVGLEPTLMAHETIELPFTPPKIFYKKQR